MTMTESSTTDATPSNIAAATITFSDGLIGCSSWRNFAVMIDEQVDTPVAVLQSLDDSRVALMVTDPTSIIAGYTLPLNEDDRSELELEDAAPLVYCTLSVRDGWLTANLLGPLLVNPTTGKAKQIVLADSPYSSQYRITQVGS